MVPIGMASSTPFSRATSAIDGLGLLADELELLDRRDQRHHDLRTGVLAGAFSDAVASATARTCSRYSPGTTMPSRTPRMPSMGFCSDRRCTSCSRCTSSSSTSPLASATATLTDRAGQVRQELVQRRVEQTDRDRQPVHRGQDRRKSLRCSASSSSSAPCRSVVVTRQDDPLDQLAPLAQEHVLGAAQPDALRAEAAGPRRVLGSVGVGPDSHPSRASACFIIRRTASTRSRTSSSSSPSGVRRPVSASTTGDGDDRDLAEEDLAGPPSIEITSPSLTCTPSGVVN